MNTSSISMMNQEDSEYLGYVFKVTHLRIQYFYSNSWLGYLPVFIFAQNIIPQNLSIIPCAQEIIAHTMIRGDTELLDGSTMFLGRITLIALPIVLRIFLG